MRRRVLSRRARARADRRLEHRSGRVIILEAGRATLELFDEAQAATVDRIEAGRRVSGTVRFALEVVDSESTAERLVPPGPSASRLP